MFDLHIAKPFLNSISKMIICEAYLSFESNHRAVEDLEEGRRLVGLPQLYLKLWTFYFKCAGEDKF